MLPKDSSPQKPKILIVEDEIVTARHLKRVLSHQGYEIVGIASSGTSALTLISETSPDLLLADIGLEGSMDGIQVAVVAREEWKIPTIFLTAYSDPDTMRHARITEPYGYLVKPFADEELHATIEIALQQKSIAADRELQVQETAEILGRTQEELSRVAALLFSAQEQERQRIAREIHDDINQRLAILRMDLDEIAEKVPSPGCEAVKLEIAAATGQVDELAQDLRELSHRLHPQTLDDLGLEKAMRDLCETFQRRHSLKAQLSVCNIPEETKPSTALALYRIAQEALHNVVKHSQADSVSIALVGGTASLEFSIRDNGKGFEAGAPRRGTGLGLITMAQRAKLAGGQFEIQSYPNRGTRIRVSVPLTSQEGENAGSPRRR
jgi:signal transduction histidine kinase